MQVLFSCALCTLENVLQRFRRGALASQAVETHCGDEGLRLTEVTLNPG